MGRDKSAGIARGPVWPRRRSLTASLLGTSSPRKKQVKEEDVTMRSAHQSSLTHLGYGPGPVDGVVTQRTAEAISQYQYTNRLPVDGQPSPGLDHMIRHGG
jgi:peptidoglycan hydrolase-like protein with peptidoglycan-binding domain